MGRDNFADTLSGRRTSVNSTTNGRDVATYDRSHETGIDLFPTDEANVSRFHHCVGGFNHRHQTTTFDQSKCFRHAAIVPKLVHKRHKASLTKSTKFFLKNCF